MLGILSRSAQCNPNRPFRSDKSLAKIDESARKSGPEKPKSLVFLGFLQVIVGLVVRRRGVHGDINDKDLG